MPGKTFGVGSVRPASRLRTPVTGRALAASIWAAACSDRGTGPAPPPSPPPNRAPEALGTIPAQLLRSGDTLRIDVSPFFRDPDSDALSWTAATSNAGVAGVSVSGASMVVSALARGVATITVTARDPEGLIAQQSFEVTVPNRGPETVGEIPAQTVLAGQTATIDAASHFTDADALSYTATSSRTEMAAVTVAAAEITIRAIAPGEAMVTVGASDPDGESAEQVFRVSVPNRAPEAVGTISSQTMTTGQTASLDVADYFSDPDGDELAYGAESGNTSVLTVGIAGSSLTLTAVAAGSAAVTATAEDPGGLSAVATFEVSVSAPPGGFRIDLVFASSLTATQEAAFGAAAERWMTVLAPTELPDFEAQNWTCGDDPRFERHAAIDDVMIVAVVEEIDGPGGTLASAGPCWTRTASGLPIYGRMRFDAADLDREERNGLLENLILHEMGHVLGIGTVWDDLELLQNPASEDEIPDTHFTGPLAIAAFDDAGGTDYGGAKVPVENTGGPGTRNGHWREAVMEAELMTGWSEEGRTEPLSAITIQSLADLGYAVDRTAAGPYRLPDADAAHERDPGRLIPYGDDIWRGPIIVADSTGRIVRVIRPR